ncbi:MAG: acetyl/propionyl/methylcrotonyl-CoA carboxylase subunit alpha [Gammaproteobacteria bacterium]|nr:acetyl/propionyl/methylcrotonyl-CoA carboxylase subunit alpha [Gammaproteobacteria bacterium]
MQINKLLVANRGEIAVRIMKTCRRLGIRTVAVYSEADRGARHVRSADEAVNIGAAESRESYLSVEKIINAAHFSGADAIHPGYGFLSENPELARSCVDAGLIFVGPTAETIDAMGSKSEAKRLMAAAGVPTVPGYHGAQQSDALLEEEASGIGYPVIIKPSAGGGGKGMRIVRKAEDFPAALDGARREAMSAFGDTQMLIEKFMQRPRHIEFQIFGDAHGNVIHLFERECSLQRRYQKIIEEAPSPFVDDDLARRMGDAAVAAGRAVDYVNAGTVEFIVGADRQYFFMEMNTRLQVEHPVTEMTTGIDLVEWQLRVAAGEPLPLSQTQITRRGHALEARIYAEDPRRDFLPSTGCVRKFSHPRGRHGLRMDSSVSSGDKVSIHYDPMIAKLIVHAPDRQRAVAELRAALANTAIFGVTTNLDFLLRITRDEVFLNGDADTGYVDRNQAELTSSADGVAELALLGAACGALERRATARRAQAKSRVHRSPWSQGDAWQANGQGRYRLAFVDAAGARHVVAIRGALPSFTAEIGEDDVRRISVTAFARGQNIILEADGQTHVLKVTHSENDFLITYPGTSGPERSLLRRAPLYQVAAGDVADDAHPGSPMPGRVVALHVTQGDSVQQGQPLLVLEGMKMEYTLNARTSGSISQVHCKVGDLVEAEVPLVDIDTAAAQ